MVNEKNPLPVASSSERRVLRKLSGAIGAVAQAIEEGPVGLLRRAAGALRDAEGEPFLQSTMRQFEDLVEKGRVPRERLTAGETTTAAAELIDDLSEAVPDARRLEMLRRAFLAAAIGSEEDPEGTLALAFLKKARKFTGEQVTILGFAFAMRDKYPENHDSRAKADAWRGEAVKRSGLQFHEPVDEAIAALVGMGLLRGRIDHQFREALLAGRPRHPDRCFARST